ncbi:phosphatase PAP2 family protein [Streptomyces sp. G-G2]|uniref:phosphatase PAP2 family protein n=1 Tax=Streptomyces sp. G-G2 TaxID=3046201 RepID=UPI0024B91AB4|nr:phosphatase PAP2 family protein [Streptomyces sp. G-G2]MDJ0384840.1 phosphatase PAP2 family protein [Streptomyces sp. G-G2]
MPGPAAPGPGARATVAVRWRARLWITVLCAALFVLLAVLVGARHGLPYALDQRLHLWSLHHRPAVAVALARGITATGTGALPYLCAITAGLIAGRDARARLLTALAALGFLVLAQAVRYGLLQLVGRPRPPSGDWATTASGLSFPSGHATTSLLVAGMLAWALTRAAPAHGARSGSVLLFCWAVAVGLSRIYLGVHWPSDVLGGWLYALTWLGAAAVLLPRLRPPGPRPRRRPGAP